MNANEIWVGNDYAYVEYRPRGKGYIQGATRIRPVRLFKQNDYYASERARTMVEAIFCEKDGTARKTYAGEPLKRNVRARDILMRWEEYEEETGRRERERERLNREAELKERREQEAKTALMDRLERVVGLPREVVTSISETAVWLNRARLEEWLMSAPKQPVHEKEVVELGEVAREISRGVSEFMEESGEEGEHYV